MVLGLAVILIAAGVGVVIYRYEHRAPPTSTVTATIGLSDPSAKSLVCNPSDIPIYYDISFFVVSVSTPVTTAQFGVDIVNPLSITVPSSSPAPRALSSLPCGADDPAGWYVVYSNGPYGPWATYPFGGNGWSDRFATPTNISTQGWFDIISSADISGTEDNFTAFGIGGSHVTFTGQTIFPPWQGP